MAEGTEHTLTVHVCDDAVARYWAKVRKTDTCWLWTAKIGNGGYGVFAPHRWVSATVAHRYAYELLAGPILPAMQLDHLCRVRHCVNPAHLEPVTPRENVMRSQALTAANAKKARCVRGHSYDGLRANGARSCSDCQREKRRENPEKYAAYQRAYRRRRAAERDVRMIPQELPR